MTNNRRTKSLFKILLSQLAVALFITLLALSILFYAEGYRINFKNFKIQKTGVLYVSTFPKNATVYINGREKTEKSPFSENLLPGYYNVDVLKEGYAGWSENVKIEAEMLSDFKNVVLFKSEPQIKTLTDQRMINALNSPVDTLAIRNNNGLIYSEYEIWLENQIVTRFSTPIDRVVWYPDEKHFVFQQSDEIRVIEISGKNDTLLVKLSSREPTNFSLNDKGTEIYYKDGEEYKIAAIR